ncbi:methyltransferase [Bradyrhizobium sp. NAS96.2]|uniref:methyltransferase family protein n=1 Tax=Bradyrhizobium sp. NAS96.2 TaxID=1680160 RepID=UPI001FD8B348|nr:methyltransferase [Bradyrhizobium sp. NAS96.2]
MIRSGISGIHGSAVTLRRQSSASPLQSGLRSDLADPLVRSERGRIRVLPRVVGGNRKLVTRGPYQFTRNQMYLGLVILALGIAVWIGAWPMFMAPLAVFATVNWVHIPFEEAKMRRQFGALMTAMSLGCGAGCEKTAPAYLSAYGPFLDLGLSAFASLLGAERT